MNPMVVMNPFGGNGPFEVMIAFSSYVHTASEAQDYHTMSRSARHLGAKVLLVPCYL